MVWRSYHRSICDNFCKLLQKQTYTFLSSRHGVFLCFVAFFLSFLSVLQFGEVALEWSVARYQKTLFPYNDNILHQSYQHRLCLPMPIDIVYTWVNGTDPRLLVQLAKLKNELEKNLNASSSETDNKNDILGRSHPEKDKAKTTPPPNNGCPYTNCVPLNSMIMNLHTKTRLIDLKTVDPVFQNAIKIYNVTRKSSTRPNARETTLTIVTFGDETSLKLAVNKEYTIYREKVVGQRAYLTSQSVHLAVRMRAMAIVSLKGVQTDKNVLKKFLDAHFTKKLKQLDYYKIAKVAVLTFQDDDTYKKAINIQKGLVNFMNIPLIFEPAMMVWEPFTNTAEDLDHHFSASRFADNNEMRYSLRSVEKHAPWVRKIFIVTNGQIPSWLNLDNPRVKIVTHSEIFSNQSHLPTFSSPAIESHLHRIPGLSKKFIYLNDDVMFGKDVWPDDFFTHAKGQKVFLSWPVPNCNEGCPTTWISDKYCDKACNVSDCDWDGGDCIGSKPNVPRQWQSVLTGLKRGKIHEFCNSGCADTWIGDRYCDAACNNPVCGFDAGDCGVNLFSELHSVMLYENTKIVHLPKGLHAMYFNLSNVFGQGKIIEGEQNGSPVLRSVTIAQKFKVMTLTFYPNLTLTTISLRLVGLKTMNETSRFEIKFNVTVDTRGTAKVTVKNQQSSQQVASTSSSAQHVSTTLYPIRVYNFSEKENNWNIDVNRSLGPTWKSVDQQEYCVPQIPNDITIPDDVLKKLEELGKDLKDGDITDKGYRRKTGTLLRERLGITCEFHPTAGHSEMRYMKSMTASTVYNDIATNVIPAQNKKLPERYTTRHLTSYSQDNEVTERGFLPWERQGSFKTIQDLQKKQALKESYLTIKAPKRNLLDAFSSSLLHVNRIYNKAFGYKARKVPSHMPHMVDVDIMNELQEKFHDEFDKTSSHKLRSPDDMQFALSYFYYIIDQTKDFNITRLFTELDIDNSGTLSDRELRTLMAKITSPLDSKKIKNFLKILRNCSIVQNGDQQPRPKSDQQYGYDLPLITDHVVHNCKPIIKQLNNSKKRESKFQHEILGEDDVTFKMIKNNITHVLLQLDYIRQKTKKFICLNDNIDHGKQNASSVKAVLVDFYESLFPVHSQFELPDNLRNQFLYMDDLVEWKKEQQVFEVISGSLLVVLVVIVCVYIFWYPITHLVRRIVSFFWRRLRPSMLSTSSSTRLLTV